ncbi:calmodulin-A isoform X2 [Hydra vulgaris]|uniref:Calmodulin-A isoform X2 n=1 Tax=Hydra vulgaris TaxID=6087 RepID=A0ABM4CUX9_HYDVU
MSYKQRFSPDQIREFNDAFLLLDTNDQGYLPISHLKEMLLTIGYNLTDDYLQRLTLTVDDGNGKLVFDEFMELIDLLESNDKHEKDAKAAYNAFDFDGVGYIAANDVKEALMFVMEKASEEDRKGILAHFKLEKNRKIYFKEFKDMVSGFAPQKTDPDRKMSKFQQISI